MQLVDQAIARLSCQVPQERLARLLAPAIKTNLLALERPHPSPMRRFGWRKRLACQNKSKAGFTNATIAHQYNFGICVVDRRYRRRSTEYGSNVQVPDADNRV